MDELFNLLSSSARIDKSKRKKKQAAPAITPLAKRNEEENENSESRKSEIQHSPSKAAHIHSEEMSAFRRRMNIQVKKGPTDIPDPISSFDELSPPTWWSKNDNSNKKSSNIFPLLKSNTLQNIASGKWIHPTPIQMQAIPSLLHRRDTLGCAPTGSGKSGAFIIPILCLASVEEHVFYDSDMTTTTNTKDCTGHIRSLILAPSRELAHQLHREVERLGENKVNGLRATLLSKSNASVISTLGGKRGLDVLVTTPLRLVDVLEKVDLTRVRLVVMDEADRLLDAHDGTTSDKSSNYAKTFLEQMDTILSHIPPTAVRALFSATIGSNVRALAESFLRNPLDITVGAVGSTLANPDIEQKLVFCGREEGKLLYVRQLIQKGIRPPVIVFLQSKDRAQALYSELLYDGIHVNCIHAGKSQNARDIAVAKFRTGETWVLICTDLVARGVDFKGVNMVINYDVPDSGVTYVHRIGRTGRAGNKGEAITLYTESDYDHIGTIANVMKLSGCNNVPDWIFNQKRKRKVNIPPKRKGISTKSSRYDREQRKKKKIQVK